MSVQPTVLPPSPAVVQPCSTLNLGLSISLSPLLDGVEVHGVDITALNIKGRNRK